MKLVEYTCDGYGVTEPEDGCDRWLHIKSKRPKVNRDFCSGRCLDKWREAQGEQPSLFEE